MTTVQQQATVLVKKPDGTFTRMTLAEVKKMKAAPLQSSIPAQTSQAPQAKPQIKPAVSAPRTNAPTAKLSKSLNTTAPKKDLGKESLEVKAAKEDFVKPLEDLTKKPNSPLTSPPRVNQVEEVLKKIKFNVPGDIQNRLRGMIQLYLKDIRSAEQTKDKAKEPIRNGGLGLEEKQAEELIQICDIILSKDKNRPLNEVPVLKVRAKETVELPQVYQEPPVPAMATPFNSFVHGAASTKREDEKEVDKIFEKPLSATFKTVMNDVEPVKPAEMGPVEEVQYFTITDFRRLSSRPDEAAARLKQKLVNLRDESVVLYMDALAAWRRSPLYLDYVRVLTQGLKERRKLNMVTASDTGKITAEEISALVRMEKELE